MSAYHKSIFRSFFANKTRFIVITAIIIVSICFVSGLGATPSKIRNSFNENLIANNVSDLTIMSKSETGFSSSELNDLKEYVKTDYLAFSLLEMKVEDYNARIYVEDLNSSINKLTLISGRLPLNDNEIVVEEAIGKIKSFNIGDSLNIFNQDKEIVGVVTNPLRFSSKSDTDYQNDEPLELILYFNSSDTLSYFCPINCLYVIINSTKGLNKFSNKYIDKVDEYISLLKEETNDSYAYLSLEENRSTALLSSYCDKVEILTFIFPIFFIAVAALVLSTTMSRMIEEERSSIGCYMTLGYSKFKIINKYLSFVLCCLTIGISIGLLIGAFILPNMIYQAFGNLFTLPPISHSINLLMGIICSIGMGLVVLLTSFIISFNSIHVEPFMLLNAKAPKCGKKIILERIKFIWNRLKFKYKSTIRNIFRYKGRLLMIVISVAGATALVTAGCGLYDVTSNGALINVTSDNDMSKTISAIAVVVVLFAALLTILVLYNLINMNIGERIREIATLRVLGYHQIEVIGYMYREIFVMSLFGIFIGIPLGYFLLDFIFSYLDMGSVSDIHFFSYLLTLGFVIVFFCIVALLLVPKIKNVDMNDSLKTLE